MVLVFTYIYLQTYPLFWYVTRPLIWKIWQMKQQNQLRSTNETPPQDVIRLKASARAFAALVDGCRLVTWGDPRAGGDSSMVAVMF